VGVEVSCGGVCGDRIEAVMGEEKMPAAVAVESRQSEESFIAFQTPELTGELHAPLILGAG
jgi:hypothetical protein